MTTDTKTEAIDQVSSHVHPPRPKDGVAAFQEVVDDMFASQDVAVAESADAAIAEAETTMRPSIAAVHQAITAKATRIYREKSGADELRDELRKIDAMLAKESADLLDLMRDAGIASTMIETYRGPNATVTVVVRHDYDIVDLDAAVGYLAANGVGAPMTEPKVDTAGLKRLAKISPGPIEGIVPTESAHLRWT